MSNLKKPASFITSGFFLALLFFTEQNCFAEHPSPLLTRNESPFSLIFGLPLASSALLLKENSSRWISSVNISNTINAQSNTEDNLFIDIETWHVNFLYDYGFKDNWMLRFQLPYIVHSGGFLDTPIDSYHQALGLPEDIRPYFARNQVDIDLSHNNETLTDIGSKQKSLGDISIQIAWQANKTQQHALSYWLSLKLPTGDEDKLTGSGATDIAGWASMNWGLTDTRWLYGQTGLIYMSDSDDFKALQNNWAIFGNAGIKFQPWDNFELKAQFDFHSALYDSDLEFLSHVLQFTFGGSYNINKKHKLDFSVVEDIQSSSSPDVNFNISWWVYYN